MDFAWGRRPKGKIAGAVLFGTAVLLAVLFAWQYAVLQSELDKWQVDWQRLRQADAMPRAADAPEEQQRLKTELRFANRVIEKLDMPWDALFAAVESASSEQSTLLGIEPDTETREVHLTAEAKNFAAMLDYLKQVRQSSTLQGAYLASHQINQQDPQKPVGFTIHAAWADPVATATTSVAQASTESTKP